MMQTISRRLFLQGTLAAGALCALPSGLVLANANTDKRLVVVILRGGMDGLAAVVPIGDPNYKTLRGNMALDREALLSTDGFFGFHPSLKLLHDMYQKKELLVVHAAASPYRERSHFDAQNVLELGSTRPNGLRDGWLNRLVGAINVQSDEYAMAMGQTLPLIMRGSAKTSNWAPSVLPGSGDDYLSLLDKIYATDPLFSQTYRQAVQIQDKADHLMVGDNKKDTARKSYTPQAFITMAQAAGKWLGQPDGPRIATLEISGWDTHAQQGVQSGRLANNFDILARGIEALKMGLGKEAWSKTVVVALTEFGRTAYPNGNMGTDHGTASVSFVAGGAVKGGRVISDWPGLSDDRLYEGRDLRATIDIRSITKGVLADMYDIPLSVLSQSIYPDSAAAKSLSGLLI